MRNIKYRAWNKAERVMISADDLCLDSGLESPLWKVLEEFQKDFDIMRFTGMIDVDGVEIYEDDIVYFKPIDKEGHYHGVVKYTDKLGCFYFDTSCEHWFGIPSPSQIYCHFPDHRHKWQVVGNIYANPSIKLGPVKRHVMVKKFRAWDKKEQKMIQAEDLFLKFCNDLPFHRELMKINSYFELSQFTGLIDMNGVEIYEGDYVKRIVVNGHNKETIDRTFLVEWGKTELLPFNKFSSDDLWEVVGNVYG